MTKYPANDRESHLNSDETMAERLATLALLFMNTHHPLILNTSSRHSIFKVKIQVKKKLRLQRKPLIGIESVLPPVGYTFISVTLSDGANAYHG